MSCPITSCTNHVRSGQLMCISHWRMVPRALQRAVNAKWRAWLNAEGNDLRRDASGEYRKARDAAVAHVVGLVSPLIDPSDQP